MPLGVKRKLSQRQLQAVFVEEYGIHVGLGTVNKIAQLANIENNRPKKPQLKRGYSKRREASTDVCLNLCEYQ